MLNPKSFFLIVVSSKLPGRGLLWSSPCCSIRTKYISTQDVRLLFHEDIIYGVDVDIGGGSIERRICEA